MFVRRVPVNVTTDGSGNATAYSGRLTGQILGIAYVKNDFASGVDFTITAENTGETIWAQLDVNASVTVYPRRVVQTTAGVNISDVVEPVYVAAERVKIAIAQGGNAKSGMFHILLG